MRKNLLAVFGIITLCMFFATDVQARGCSISDFKLSPNPPYTLGTHVQLYVKSNCGTVRFEINGQAKAEIGSSEQWETWKTEEFGSGTHTVCAVARGDGGWENADRRCQDVYVSGGQAPTTGGASGRCYVTSFTVTPASGPIGTVFNLSSQGQCDGNMRAARYSIDGSGFGEHSNNTYNTGWSSSGYSSGTHTICYLVTSGTWSQAAQSCVTISLTVDGSPGNDVAEGDQTAPETDGTGPSGQSQGSDASSCQGSALSLSPGDTARISPGPDNNLRRNPSTDSSLIGSIPAGGSFTILDGPRCGNGYWWWEVDYNGKEGWTAQGDEKNLWFSLSSSPPSQPSATPRSPQAANTPLPPAIQTPSQPVVRSCRAEPVGLYFELNPLTSNRFDWVIVYDTRIRVEQGALEIRRDGQVISEELGLKQLDGSRWELAIGFLGLLDRWEFFYKISGDCP